MDTEQVFIALGSNLEPRREKLAAARRLLQGISCGEWQESSIRETEPVGPPGQGPYLNQVVSFQSDWTAHRILYFCKGVEIVLGRKPRGHWQSREIDLDLLYCGSQIHKAPNLNLPHLRIAERRFVLEPLCDIAPDWQDPRTHLSTRAMLDRLCAPSPFSPEAS